MKTILMSRVRGPAGKSGVVRCERHGPVFEAPRRRRCQGIVEEWGWTSAWMATDPDLEPLPGDPEFEAIVAPLLQNGDE